MANNLGYTEGSGAIVATDEISGEHFQRIKTGYGSEGSYTDVSDQTPMPTTDDTIIALLAAMLERMPRTTGNDQMAVSVESQPAITISANQDLRNISGTLGTVTTLNQFGGKPAILAADAIVMQGTSHIYNNIIVS